MERRHLIGGAAALAASLSLPPARAADSGSTPARSGPTPFDSQTVRNLARTLSAQPFKAPDTTLPAPFSDIGYDTYRQLRFDPNQALWRGTDLPFHVQFFHRGWLFKNKVEIYEVADGHATEIVARPEMFSYPPGMSPPQGDLGFAGFRLHYRINRPDYFDEIAVFLGASYFRAVGRNLLYGLSSRGLSLKTADPAGEEFPFFRAFWIERPQPGSRSIVVTALIDSPSTTASMRITIRPGDDTVMDTELTLFPRVDLKEPGIATGTSMFLFDPSDRAGIDDWRVAVHDSNGLMMLTGRGESLWRHLANPQTLQVSDFLDWSPRGFGLMQRSRDFSDFDDLEARYEKRPSLWVEPIGDWGEGAVQLVEIPTKLEIHDNIVAFWRPKQPLRAKAEHNFTYRLHWCAYAPLQSDLGRFVSTRAGAAPNGRVFVLEAKGPLLKALPPDAKVEGRVTANTGKIENVVVLANPEDGAWRVSFNLVPGAAKLVELRATLMQGDTPLTETWVYRWTG